MLRSPQVKVEYPLAVGIRTTQDLLNALKGKVHPPTDYQVAKLLGISKQAVYRYRANRGSFDDDVAIKVAEILGLKHEFVLSIVAAERTGNDQAREAWLRVVERMKGAVTAALLLGLALPLTPDYSLIPTAQAADPFIHYTKLLILLATLALWQRAAICRESLTPQARPPS